MSSKTFTSFGCCDILGVSIKEREVLAELQAITWDEETMEGSLAFAENTWMENKKEFPDIMICFLNERGIAYKIVLSGVTVLGNNGKDIWNFKYSNVMEQESISALLWDK